MVKRSFFSIVSVVSLAAIVNVFSTHLDNSDADIRSGADARARLVCEWLPGPAVIAGDLYAPPSAPELQPRFAHAADAWLEALAANRATAIPTTPQVRTHVRGGTASITWCAHAA
jgi:endonuclease/exonuclease/phosphatase family metal-dependent hydrolase